MERQRIHVRMLRQAAETEAGLRTMGSRARSVRPCAARLSEAEAEAASAGPLPLIWPWRQHFKPVQAEAAVERAATTMVKLLPLAVLVVAAEAAHF